MLKKVTQSKPKEISKNFVTEGTEGYGVILNSYSLPQEVLPKNKMSLYRKNRVGQSKANAGMVLDNVKDNVYKDINIDGFRDIKESEITNLEISIDELDFGFDDIIEEEYVPKVNEIQNEIISEVKESVKEVINNESLEENLQENKDIFKGFDNQNKLDEDETKTKVSIFKRNIKDGQTQPKEKKSLFKSKSRDVSTQLVSTDKPKDKASIFKPKPKLKQIPPLTDTPEISKEKKTIFKSKRENIEKLLFGRQKQNPKVEQPIKEEKKPIFKPKPKVEQKEKKPLFGKSKPEKKPKKEREKYESKKKIKPNNNEEVRKEEELDTQELSPHLQKLINSQTYRPDKTVISKNEKVDRGNNEYE